MDRRVYNHRQFGLLLALAVMASCGCQTVKTPEERIAKSNVPREFTKVTMPDYVIEPPDLIIIEVLEALPVRPISGEHLVRPDGKVSLGFYGEVYVTGLTIAEAKEKIILHLREYLRDQTLGLIRYDEAKDEYVDVEPAKSAAVFVDVSSYNSKVYYVQGDVGSPGRLPITGNETVLDAINYAGGLTPTGSLQNIQLVRPSPPGGCCEQILPVNLPAIINKGDATTNYQLMPGDRLVVYRDPIVRTTVFLDRLASPFNSVISSILQYTFVARSIKSVGVPINGAASTTGAARGGPALGGGSQ